MNRLEPAVFRARTVLACVLLATLAGCSLWSDEEDPQRCESVEEYQDAQTAREIAIPAGLDRPDGSTRLYVPPGPEPAEPLSQNVGCLAEPPDYFDKPLAAE